MNMERIKKILITILTVMLVSITRRIPRARRLSSGITTLTLVGVVLLVAAGSASADTAISQSSFNGGNYNITEGGYYYLTDDLTCNSGNPGINIRAANVIIDGKCFSITGNADAAICAVGGGSESTASRIAGIVNGYNYASCGYDNVTIKDLEIKSFCTGISVMGCSGYIQDITIDNCIIHDNGFFYDDPAHPAQHGIHLSFLKNSTISNCTIYDTHGHGDYCTAAGNGIYGYGGGSSANYLTIHNNTLYDNNQSGMFLKYMMRNCTISNNTAYGNGWGSRHESAGINLRCIHTSYNIVEYNNCTGNDGAGFNIGGQHNIVRYNIANDSTWDGIILPRTDGGSRNNSMDNNTACRNGRNGIRILSNCLYNTIHNNTFCKNVEEDIYDSDDTVGDDNTCNSAFGYNDTSAINPPPYCVYQCPDTEPDLVIQDKTEAWVGASSYTITYTVCNVGSASANAGHAGVYINGPLVGTFSYPALGASTCDSPRTVGPYTIGAGGIDTIVVCADIHNTTGEINEHNNCTENRFGGPDLILYDFEPAIWVDQSYKRYNLNYTIKNVGDSASQPTRVNISELGAEKWWWIDNTVPALNPGDTWSNEVGPFVLGGTTDHLQAFVNDNHAFPENYWGGIHEQYERFQHDHGWTCECCICGDVNGDTGVGMGDALAIILNNIDTCHWAADVDCSCGVLPSDALAIILHPTELDCCVPGYNPCP